MHRVPVLAAVVLALAWTASGGAATRILAIGDFGVGGTVEPATGNAVHAWEAGHPADLLVTLGDNDYTASPPAFRSNWSDAFGWLGGAGVGVHGTLGNHDVRVREGRYEFSALSMPAKYYERHFPLFDLFVLDSNSVGSTQTRWLRRHLAASTAVWKVVTFHHPAYTCGGYLSNPAVVANWVPLFRRLGVDLVLSGHDHNYQRFVRNHGVTYIVHGGGGQRLYSLRSCPSTYPRRAFARKTHGFLDLLVRRTVLRVKAVTLSGRVLDRVAIYP